ncbi:unnamed protein product [Fusarium graminearum]|nr:unnamed protein product [Fusarium graminearum]
MGKMDIPQSGALGETWQLVSSNYASSRASWLHACVALQLVLPTAKIYTRVKDTSKFVRDIGINQHIIGHHKPDRQRTFPCNTSCIKHYRNCYHPHCRLHASISSEPTEIFFALTNRCVSQLVPYRFFHGIAGDILILSTEKTNSAGTEPGDPWMDQTYSGLARVLVGTASGSCAI